jgi:hypothetical protein
MPLNMELPFAHSKDVGAVEGAWPVIGLSSHQHMHAGCWAFGHTSEKLRSGPGSGSTWFGRVSQLEIGVSSCVLVASLPRRAKLGGVLVLCAQYVHLPKKQLVFPKRTSGGKPVQGHGSVAHN